MKVKSLLAKAAKCNTEADANALLDTLQRVFGNAKAVHHLPEANSEAYMEEEKAPFIRFELNKEISEHYITMIRPEIRDGKFVVSVVTNNMLDGMGMSSQSWEAVEGMDDLIENVEDKTFEEVAEQAKELAIANHAELIERVGVTRAAAKEAAEQSW